jgi:iron complex outermembrane receptor protein
MNRLAILFVGLLCRVSGIYAQQTTDSLSASLDSVIRSYDLNEIVITAKTSIDHTRQAKPASTVEEYLQSAEKVNLIKRGNYAWEPTVNTMTTERISVTIDGMKIFHACTDNMDPVTSYVETVNLSKVNIGSGFEAGPNASNNIGGSLDLQLNKVGFCCEGWEANANLGYETNGNYRIAGTDLAFSDSTFYINSGLFHRRSDNYRAGGNREIAFSQFTKYNFFANLGYLVGKKHAIETTFIYDRASDVGYPALAMDVKTAEGLIASLSYRRENLSRFIARWETKLYANSVVHIMDDTGRPDVPVHMDMPGKTRTGGIYSLLEGRTGKHRYSFNWDAYYNRSYAEMTMYPSDPSEKEMFMLTWPDVRTLNTGLFAADEYRFNEQHSVRLSSKWSFQRDGIHSDFGLNTLQIYYPGMAAYTNRLVGNVSGRYLFRYGGWETSTGVGYGNRVPSVSEAYGFYLFNTFDTYDYLGNPHLKNESSVEANIETKWTRSPLIVKAGASYFYFTNYIIGKADGNLSPMTIGASGVKVYGNLPHASVLNVNLSLKYLFPNGFVWNGRVAYSRGKDNSKGNLPLIPPLSYESSLAFKQGRFSAEFAVSGASRQTHYSAEYGEDGTKGYFIGNVSIGYGFKINKAIFSLKSGVENVFDRYYSTYADWKNIPRKGRKVFVNLGISVLEGINQKV